MSRMSFFKNRLHVTLITAVVCTSPKSSGSGGADCTNRMLIFNPTYMCLIFFASPISGGIREWDCTNKIVG